MTESTRFQTLDIWYDANAPTPHWWQIIRRMRIGIWQRRVQHAVDEWMA